MSGIKYRAVRRHTQTTVMLRTFYCVPLPSTINTKQSAGYLSSDM